MKYKLYLTFMTSMKDVENKKCESVGRANEGSADALPS